MECYVALDPNLDLSSRGVAAAWNAAPERRALAEARAADRAPAAYPLDPQIVERGLIVLSAVAGAAGTLVLDALKDAVKEVLSDYFKQKVAPPPQVEVEAIRQPGGAYLIVVTREEQ